MGGHIETVNTLMASAPNDLNKQLVVYWLLYNIVSLISIMFMLPLKCYIYGLTCYIRANRVDQRDVSYPKRACYRPVVIFFVCTGN